MPPKVKTDQNMIVTAAFNIAKNEGFAAITAQKVAAMLGTSVAPIFRVFQTVEQLRVATAEKINCFHVEYIKNHSAKDLTFLSYGIAYIQFAKQFPYLFETIMHPIYTKQYHLNEQISKQLGFIVDSIINESSLSTEQAKELFYHIWIYTHGIACFVYQGNINFTEQTEKQLLIDAFKAFLKNYKT